MTINQIRYFVEVAREKTIMRVAKKLYTSESTINYAISKLEEELGYKLFTRSKKGMVLTEKGKLIYKQAEMVLETVDCWYLKSNKGVSLQRVRIVAPPIIRHLILKNVLCTVYEVFDFQVDVYIENGQHIFDVIGKESDAIVIDLCEKNCLDALYKKCIELNMFCECMYRDRGFFYYNGQCSLEKDLNLETVYEYNMVCYSENSMRGLFGDLRALFPNRIALPSSDEQWELIKTNKKIAGFFTNLMAINNSEDLLSGKIKRSALRKYDTQVDWMMIYSEKLKKSENYRAVIELIREEFKKISKCSIR